MSFFKSLFSQKARRAEVFEHLIETISNKDDQCEWIKGLSFEAATTYMKEAGARVLSTGDPYPEESVLYEVIVNKRAYRVLTSRDMQKTGILLTAEFIKE